MCGFQTKCHKLGSISSRYFRRIVSSAKEKCVMSKTPLPQNSVIPPVVIINPADTTEIITPSINDVVLNFSDHSTSMVNNNNNLETLCNFPEIPNLIVPNHLLPQFDQTLTNDNNDICDKLRNWILHFNISHNGANSLLTILRSEGM